jgi:hypothetical protein
MRVLDLKSNGSKLSSQGGGAPQTGLDRFLETIVHQGAELMARKVWMKNVSC